MKILILCKKVPYPTTDGESIVIMNDIRCLRALGHEVYLYCLNTRRHRIDTSDFQNYSYWNDFKSSDIDPNSFKTIFYSILNSKPFQISRFFESEIEKNIEEYAKINGIDTVICQGLAMTLYSRKLTFLKKIYRVHNVEHSIWKNLARNSFNIIKKITLDQIANSLKKFEKNELNSFEWIVSLSKNEEEYFKKNYDSKSISIAINLSNEFSSEYHSQREGLLFIGSLDWLPNREGLDWFLSEIYPSISHIPLTIAGKGNFNIKKQENITVISNFDSLEDLFNRHRLMLVPLKSGAGIRIKILEAMLYGMPTLSTPIGAEGIELTNDAILLKDTSNEWVKCIQNTYFNSELLENMSNYMKSEYHKNYSIESIKSAWGQVI